jgi:hypothetical protein
MNKINKNKSTIGDQTGDPTGNLPGWPTCLHPGENYHHPDTHPPAGDPGIANPGPIPKLNQNFSIKYQFLSSRYKVNVALLHYMSSFITLYLFP